MYQVPVPLSSAASFQETLPLKAEGDLLSNIDVRDLDVDPEIAAALSAEGPLCFLDFEATGLDPHSDELIEVGAARIAPGGSDARVFNSFIHVDRPLPTFIRRLTGIADSDLAGAPPIARIAVELDKFIGDATVVAHNASFEAGWLTRAIHPRFAEHRFLDSLDLFALVHPDARNMKLDTFCRLYLNRRERHRALDDAIDTLRVIAHLADQARRGSPELGNALWALEHFDPTSLWRPRLASLVATIRAPERDVQAGGAPPAIAKSTRPPVAFDRHAILERLSDADAGREVIEAFLPRDEQIELAAQAFDTFTGKRGKTVRLCEAGTGIGKTLAYLAVAIPFARKTNEQIVISTSTKLLQTQLMEKDIPAAARLMGYDDLRFAAVKGRANYVCRTRLNHFLEDAQAELATGDGRAAALVAAFARNAPRGEVDRIPGVLYHICPSLEQKLRDVVSAEANECSRQTCETTPGDCVFRTTRKKVEGAEIIVTNHDLLLRWPPDYPPLRHLIIDEVHELVEKADIAYGMKAGGVELLHRLRAVVTGKEASLRRRLPAAVVDAAHQAVELITTIGEEVRNVAGNGAPGAFYRNDLPVPLDGPGPTWNELIIRCDELCIALDRVAHGLDSIVDDETSEAAAAADVLREAAQVLSAPFPRPPSELVARFSGLGRSNVSSWQLVVTPVSPAGDFYRHVLAGAETVFGTSATIGVGPDPLGSVSGLELDQTAAGRFEAGVSLDSPFDYANNLKAFFLSDPTQRDRLTQSTAQVIATVARRLGGKTLALFTSRERLNTVAELLEDSLRPEGITVIAPISGSADPHDLVRDFMESEHAVLLGARAFWQGVDVPGDVCQALIIEKLPFDPPGDPLAERRQQILQENGGNGFMDYSLPRMLLRLKQMVGRLIRTPTDRGIVVLVESRSDRRYFSRLFDALPPRTEHSLIPLAELDAASERFFSARPRAQD